MHFFIVCGFFLIFWLDFLQLSAIYIVFHHSDLLTRSLNDWQRQSFLRLFLSFLFICFRIFLDVLFMFCISFSCSFFCSLINIPFESLFSFALLVYSHHYLRVIWVAVLPVLDQYTFCSSTIFFDNQHAQSPRALFHLQKNHANFLIRIILR